MFAKIIQIFDRYRQPVSERYQLSNRYAPAVFISTFLIAIGVLSLVMAAYLGTGLFATLDDKPSANQNKDSEQLMLTTDARDACQ